jgi:hypothetical protein
MKVDKDVERAVRRALAGAVAGEAERFDSAVMAIASVGDDFANASLDLVFAIDSAALFSIHEAQRPDDEQLRLLSEEFTSQEAEWADIDARTTLAYLTALADAKSPLEVLPIKEVMFAAFAIGGWLLSAFIPDDAEWTDFLDVILDKLVATPEAQ